MAGDFGQAEWETEVTDLAFASSNKLNGEGLLGALQGRFSKGDIYTYVGEVLVSVNPCRALPKLYAEPMFANYRDRRLHERPPHLFGLCDTAYQRLRRFGRNSCVIATGESGSGKTVAAKATMRYLTSVSPTCWPSPVERRLRETLVALGPLLDSFGNAVTARNDNSSRFGKSIDIIFDFRGCLLGANIKHFMLELNRIATYRSGERNFHIFYQFLRGMSADRLRRLHLKRGDVSSYHYLSLGENVSPPGVDDRGDFTFIERALQCMQITQDNADSLWRALAAVLLLGQMKFERYDEGASVLDRDLLDKVAGLLSLPSENVELAICFRQVTTGDHDMLAESRLTVEESVRQRDLLGQAVYNQAFLWLIDQINKAVQPSVPKSDPVMSLPGAVRLNRYITIVDMYGFEKLEASSFEQLCINYSCEKLEQLYLRGVLLDEQELYAAEGIKYTKVKVQNNADVCEVFDNLERGVFAVLDQASNARNVAEDSCDQAFLELMDSGLGSHNKYTSRQVDPTDEILCPFRDFKIRHFAGNVTYTISHFVWKNRNILTQKLHNLFEQSSNPVLKKPVPTETHAEVTPSSSVGIQFRDSVSELVASIEKQDTYHIRCIKPNDTKQPNNMAHGRCLEQIQQLLLVETALVRRQGYVAHWPFTRFYGRYWPTLKEPMKGRGDKAECKRIIEIIVPSEASNVVYGKSRMFFLSRQALDALEQVRDEELEKRATRIRRAWRSHTAVMHFRLVQHAFKSGSVSFPQLRTTPQRQALHDLYHRIYQRWKQRKLHRNRSGDQQVHTQLKSFGHLHLEGRRRRWGADRLWHGDYLSVYPVFRTALPQLKKDGHFDTILFSAYCLRVNTRLKVSDRAILVTSSCVVILDPSKNFAIKKQPIPLQKIKALCVSASHDQAVVLRTDQKDQLIALRLPDHRDDFVGEMVCTICNAMDQLGFAAPKVVVSHKLDVSFGATAIKLDFDYQFNETPVFKKVASGHLTLIWPA